MGDSGKATILIGHHVPPAVLGVVERAEKYAVLVTAYLRPWVHLEQVVATARKRTGSRSKSSSLL